VLSHPSLEKSEGWGTPAVRVIQGCATRRRNQLPENLHYTEKGG
jgi:hypothetical protein